MATNTKDLSSIYLPRSIPTTCQEPKTPKDCAKYLQSVPKGYILTLLMHHEAEPQERGDERNQVLIWGANSPHSLLIQVYQTTSSTLGPSGWCHANPSLRLAVTIYSMRSHYLESCLTTWVRSKALGSCTGLCQKLVLKGQNHDTIVDHIWVFYKSWNIKCLSLICHVMKTTMSLCFSHQNGK